MMVQRQMYETGCEGKYTGKPIKIKLKPNAAPSFLLEMDKAVLGNQAESS
jgi:hypothetical protein